LKRGVLVLEMNGDVGIEKQGEELEEGMRLAAIGAAPGASYLHPLVLEESESDSEVQTWIINHPSSSPEGSLLHAVYFQLLGAGFDGTTVRELFRSKVHTWRKAFKKRVAALAEPEMEFEEIHQSVDALQMPSRAENRDDGSNGKQLQQQMPHQMPESVPCRRHHIAAKETAANVGSSNFQGQIWTRATRPLPPHIGVRKNPPVKKNKGYLKNRLQ